MNRQQALEIYDRSEEIVSAGVLAASLDTMASALDAMVGRDFPLVLAVMGGAPVFAGMLLPRLRFPLEFDYLHLTRYGQHARGSESHWRVAPAESVKDRVVVVLDEIMNEGRTMAAMRDQILELGAARFVSAVLCEKIDVPGKMMRPDFRAVELPDRRIFGCGMDIDGYWANLSALRAPL